MKLEARAVSENAEAYLLLAPGTYCLLNGRPLTYIYILPVAENEIPTPTPEYLKFISRVFELGPEGSNFDPPIKLIFNYNPALIPAGIDELDMFIARWDDQLGQWAPLETHVDTEKQIIWVEISDFSIYTVMAGAKPADISVGELTITPGEINEGENATVSASLVNSGDMAGTYEAVLKVDGIEKEKKVVDVGKQESVAISFDLVGLGSGTHEIDVGGATGSLTVVEVIELAPAAFTVSSLGVSADEVEIGEEVNITVRVDNTGEMEGAYEVVCSVDGVVMAEKEITLAGGRGELVVFTLAIDQAGEKTIVVNGLTHSLVVNEVDEEPGLVAEMPTQEIPEDNTSTSGDYWWWWIIVLILGVCALMIVTALYLRRKGEY